MALKPVDKDENPGLDFLSTGLSAIIYILHLLLCIV